MNKSQWTIVLLLAAVALYVSAYFEPMWGFYLFSPQYPRGLTLSIYLNRIGGDVTEVNILNHYIGMAKLDQAARLEREFAVYGIALMAIAVLISGLRTRYSKILTLPALVFPLIFVAAMYFWMYRFGHELSPEAPVRVPAFTPTMIGEGKIGNFHTIGLPGLGFYMSVASSVCVVIAHSRKEV